jgi:glycosyltransferase involved in cell wall biosynthesis
MHVHRLRGVGGSERHLLTLLPALRARGVDARFLGLDVGDPGPFYDQLRQAGVPFERARSPRDVDPLLAAALIRAVRRERPDVVHTHLVHADVYGALAALAGRVALVSTKHNDDPFRVGPFRRVERLITRRASTVVCITAALARFNEERVGLPAAKLEVIHYGLDELPAAWGPPGGPALPVGARVLLAVARLEHQKGLDVAIEALARLLPAHPGAVLVVLSQGGRLERELRDLAEARGVSGSVFLAGSVGDVADWLSRAELLVHPARWEGFGLAVLEAMLAGLPVVATNVSAIPEVVLDGHTGMLVPPDDPEQLAAALDTLLSDRERARALGAAGHERARALFSVEQMAARTIEVYERALARRPAS